MTDLDHLVESVASALDEKNDSTVMEVDVRGSDVDALRSLEGDIQRRTYVSSRVAALGAPRAITRIVISGGGLRVDVPVRAPNENLALRPGERLIG